LHLSDLIQACIKEDRSAQNLLYSRYSPIVFPVCQRYAKHKSEAEEILLEGFLKAFKHLHQYKGIGPFEAWLRKIMVNTALRKLRNNSKQPAVVSIDLLADHISLTTDSSNDLYVKELTVLIQKLPVAYRMVFNLYVFEGLKHREIAELLAISEGTSKSNLSDARRILQRKLLHIEESVG
jgi:RNA polymerase sigma-70 factor (ECF subfamily)